MKEHARAEGERRRRPTALRGHELERSRQRPAEGSHCLEGDLALLGDAGAALIRSKLLYHAAKARRSRGGHACLLPQRPSKYVQHCSIQWRQRLLLLNPRAHDVRGQGGWPRWR
eukprot:6662208-Prymnesium_polylepis.1